MIEEYDLTFSSLYVVLFTRVMILYFEQCSIASNNVEKMNSDHKEVFDEVMASQASASQHSKVFFIDAPGGSGKTFVFKTILAPVRREGTLPLAAANSPRKRIQKTQLNWLQLS